MYVNYTDEEVFTLRFHCLQKRRWRALLNEGLVRRLSSVICNMYTTSLQYLLYLPGDYKVDGWMEGGGGEGDQTRRRWKRRDGRERGQAAGRRLVTVKSIIIIIISVVFFHFCWRFPERNATLASALSPIPTGNPDACIYECFLKHSILSAKAIFLVSRR